MSANLQRAPYGARLIARAYAAEHDTLNADARFFLKHALSGPAIVLGCGTGRISRALASVRPVTGLDLSPPMLHEAIQLGGGPTYVLGDLRDFSLGSFTEAYVPNATFSFLQRRSDKAEALACIRRALAPGGACWLDLPLPTRRWYEPHTPEETAWQGELDGETLIRTRETWRDTIMQRITFVDRFYLGGLPTGEHHYTLSIALPDEVEWMLEANGFAVDERYGGYAGQPVNAEADRLVVRAVPL